MLRWSPLDLARPVEVLKLPYTVEAGLLTLPPLYGVAPGEIDIAISGESFIHPPDP